MAATVRLYSETPLKSGDKIDLARCIKFTVENQGSTVARIGYPGEGGLIDINVGAYREFEISWGHMFEDEIVVDFEGGKGKLLVIKYVTRNTEFI